MSRTKTLAQLRSLVENQADIVGATARYSATLLNGLINQSVQRFRERISIEGSTRYLVPAFGTLTVGSATGLPFGVVDTTTFSPNVVRTFGVDLTIDGTTFTLEHRPFEERTKYGNRPATPIAWAPYGSNIAILPPPVGAYPYTVWYLPLLSDLTTDSDTFDGVAGWEDFIVWDVFQRLIPRDGYEKVFGQASIVKDQIVADIIRGATKVSHAGGAHRGRDTMGALGIYGANLGGRRAPSTGGGLPPGSSVTNAMLAQMVARTIKGNGRYSPDNPQDLSGAEVADILPTFAGGAGGLVPTGAGNPALFLTNAGTWNAPSVGGSVSGLALSQIQDIPAPRVLGRFAGGTGAATPLTGQQVASMIAVFTGSAHGLVPFPTGGISGRVLDDSGAWVAQSGGGVSSGIANNQLLAMPPLSFKGNFSSGSGVPADLTKQQAASLMPDFTQASGAGRGFVWAPTGGVTGRWLRDDGTWQGIPTGGSGGGGSSDLVLGGPTGAVQYNGGTGLAGGSGFMQTASGVALYQPVFLPTGWAAFGTDPASQGALRGSSAFGAFARRADGLGDARVIEHVPNLYGAGRPGVVVGGGAEALQGAQVESATGAVGLRVGVEQFQVRASHDVVDLNVPVNVRARLGVQPLAFPTGAGDRLGAWTASGFANTATGIHVVGSGMALAFGANPAATGTVRLSALDEVNVRGEDGVTRRVIGANIDMSFGEGPLGGSNYYDVGPNAGHIFRNAYATRMFLDNSGLNLASGIGITAAKLAHGASLDKLGAWTPGGLAVTATGLSVGASGMRLSVGSGGPMLHASGIDMRSSDMRNVRRINGLDGIKVYGDLPDANADVASPSGPVFIVPFGATTGRVYSIVPSGAEHGDVVLIENRSAFSHSIYNTGTGLGAPSGWIATLSPSGGMTARFASGAWEFGVKYKLGGF